MEFAFIAAFCLLPPLFKGPEQYAFPGILSYLCSFCISIFLYFQLNLYKKTKKTEQYKKKIRFSAKDYSGILKFTLNSSYFFLTFGTLIVTAVCINIFTVCLSDKPFSADLMPGANAAAMIPAFFVSAFYEEVMYRMVLPGFLYCFFMKDLFEPHSKSEIKPVTDEISGRLYGCFRENPRSACRSKRDIIRFYVTELISVLVFAFSHRYAGWASVLNSFIAGIALRKCYLKSKNIFTGFAAHFLYNVFMLCLLSIAHGRS